MIVSRWCFSFVFPSYEMPIQSVICSFRTFLSWLKFMPQSNTTMELLPDCVCFPRERTIGGGVNSLVSWKFPLTESIMFHWWSLLCRVFWNTWELLLFTYLLLSVSRYNRCCYNQCIFNSQCEATFRPVNKSASLYCRLASNVILISMRRMFLHSTHLHASNTPYSREVLSWTL